MTFRSVPVQRFHVAGWSGRPAGLLTLLAGLLLVNAQVGPFGAAIGYAQSADRDPREIATQDDEAGKAAILVADEDGSDDRSRWVHRRWERDRDNEDVRVGPIITDNHVWVAKDVAAAQAIFKDQAGKQLDFPESVDAHKGPFEWKIEPLGDDVTALSACIDCNGAGGINLHQRVVVRKSNVVSVVYIFGRDKIATRELTKYFVTKTLERI